MTLLRSARVLALLAQTFVFCSSASRVNRTRLQEDFLNTGRDCGARIPSVDSQQHWNAALSRPACVYMV